MGEHRESKIGDGVEGTLFGEPPTGPDPDEVLQRISWAAVPSRTTRTRRCPHCGAPVLVGLDSDTAALPARVDPRPLSRVGEAQARLAGRWTYDAIRHGDRWQLGLRYALTILGERRFPVVAEHKCGAPPLDADNGSGLAHARPSAIPEAPPF